MEAGIRMHLAKTLFSVVVSSAVCCLAAEAQPLGAEQAATPALVPPTLEPCQGSHPPRLPQRWRAVGLMMPFDGRQLSVGEFLYDGNVPAMRATIYGLESGSSDFLVTNDGTYRIAGSHDKPSGCAAVGTTFAVPTTQWLSGNARCFGRAPLQGTMTEWWRTPAANSAGNSFWFNEATRLPWRVFMSHPSPDPPFIGDYAMTYFPTFAAVERTGLSALRDFCRVQSRHHVEHPSDSEAIATNQTSRIEDVHRMTRIRNLLPGLSVNACAGTSPARWPDRMQMTAIMTLTPFAVPPLPAEIFYDWNRHAMLTRLHDPANPMLIAAALLVGNAGYDIKPIPTSAPVCQAAYPGVVRPDWLAGHTCTCKGVIEGNAQLAPRETIEIRSCAANGSHAFWVLSKKSGAPVVFLSTLQTPGGIDLADYFTWLPDSPTAASMFEVPEACTAPDRVAPLPPPDLARLLRTFATRCAACHTAQ